MQARWYEKENGFTRPIVYEDFEFIDGAGLLKMLEEL